MYSRNDIRRRDYQAFLAAVRRSDWHETKKQKDSLGTALHNAVIFGQEQTVEELVNLLTVEELERKSSDGWTALAYAATGNLKMVKCMVTKNQNLIGIAEGAAK
ncbi:hypothetical protein DVH24_037285 [Malus domestica]|uniref:Uncharacterized protein n=1 Tax=Malus domestica TaxID=3750 RepID=A0A498HK31_MALDO|nr:hypothetical protein DVH24_037285 [Malus domestica]